MKKPKTPGKGAKGAVGGVSFSTNELGKKGKTDAGFGSDMAKNGKSGFGPSMVSKDARDASGKSKGKKAKGKW